MMSISAGALYEDETKGRPMRVCKQETRRGRRRGEDVGTEIKRR